LDLKHEDIERIAEFIPGAFCVYAAGARVEMLYCSPKMTEVMGFSLEEYETRTAGENLGFVVENDRALVRSKIACAIANDGDVDFAYRVRLEDQTFRWTHVIARRIGTMDGAPILLAIHLDTTQEIQTHAELLDRAADIVYVCDVSTWEMYYANRSATEFWHCGPFFGSTCYQALRKLDNRCPWCVVPNLLADGGGTVETHDPALDCTWRIESRRISWFGRDAFYVLGTDITEQRRAEATLRESTKRLADMVERIPAGIVVYRENAGTVSITRVNSYLLEMAGNTNEDFIEHSHDELTEERVHPDDLAAVDAGVHAMFAGERRMDITYRNWNAIEGCYRWLHGVGRGFPQDDGSQIAYAVFTDVTAEIDEKQAYRESEQRFQTATEGTGILVWEYDIAEDRVVASPGMLEEVGMPHIIEHASEALLDYVPGEDGKRLVSLYSQIAAGAKTVDDDIWLHRGPNIPPSCYHVTMTLTLDAQGRPAKAYAVGQNVTVAKLDEERYDESLQNLLHFNARAAGSLLLNFTRDACTDGNSTDPQIGTLLDSGTVDGFFAQVAGTIEDADDREGFEKEFNRRYLTRMFGDGHIEFSHKLALPGSAGDIRWLDMVVRLIRSPRTGDTEGIVNLYDITDERRRQMIIDQMMSESCDFVALVNAGTDAIEFLQVVEERAKSNLYYQTSTYTDALRGNLLGYIDPEQTDAAEKLSLPYIIAQLEHEDSYTYSFGVTDMNGEHLHKQQTYSYADRAHGMLFVVRIDVTEAYRQSLENLQRLQEALDAAEAADRAKTEFLSRISHDIRTPMNVITGMTEFAFQDMDDREKLAQDLEKIRVSNTFLLSLINDILEISKIDSGQMDLHPEPYSYADLLSNVRNMFDPLCAEKGIELSVEDREMLGAVVIDKVRFNQIVLNLMSNAVKYTPAGGSIDVVFKGLPNDDGTCRVFVIVKDNGIGMDEEFQKRMFEPFSQDESLDTQLLHERGTGLGLAIVKRIVDLMGGTVTVKSALGQGTVITVEVIASMLSDGDAGNPANESEPRADDGTQRGGHILIVEDHPLNAEITKRLLEEHGYTTATATDGAAGVKMFEEAAPHTFDAILMDIQMPVMNGYEATHALRSLDREDARSVPILAMTADAYAEDIERCRTAGMDGHIAKPVSAADLYRALGQALAR